MHRRHFLQSVAAAPLLARTPDKQRHVVIISIDGLPSYALRDETLPIPTLRRLAREGATVSAVETINPSVTWPNHTAMVTGVPTAGHQVLYNGLLVRGADGERPHVEPWVPKPDLVKAATLYDVAHSAGMSTAEVDWVAIHNAATITHAFPENPRLTDPVVREMITAGLITEDGVRTFEKQSILWRDEVWTRAGEHIIEKHRPNLLLLHWLTTDSTQHRYGARGLASTTAFALADANVQRLLNALERAGIRDSTTVFVVSDHGFKTYKHIIQANAVLRAEGLLRGNASNMACDAWAIPEGGSAMVYITHAAQREELAPKLASVFAKIPGIARVIEAKDFASLGFPAEPGGRMADLVLAAQDGYAFGGGIDGEAVHDVPAGSSPGAHGYMNSETDMDAILIAHGAGVKAGARLDRSRMFDLAPTAAHLLGLQLPGIQGRMMSEVLA